MRRVLLVAAGALLLAVPSPGRAAYGSAAAVNGADIVSADPVRDEQGDDASTFAAVSGNGRYVAFSTRARNFFADDDPDPPGAYRVGGIFRRDLQTGTLQIVASGDVHSEADDSLLTRGAQRPSISADGRFVAFSTAQALVPTDTNGAVDVYVRDMFLQPNDPGAYDLVSARDGSGAAATYEKPTPDTPGLDSGADLTGGASISGDGRMVVFHTVAASDLPAQAGATTPAFQVWVRDRQAQTTTLVSRAATGGGPAGGGTGPAGISADGTTVAWTSQNAPEQTTFLPGEVQDDSTYYYLWRRIADGAGARTRRITGPVDLDDPGCAPGTRVGPDPAALGPCYGPLTATEDGQAGIGSLLPSLSADGRTVVFLTGAGPRPNTTTGGGLDLYMTSMAPGVSRKQGTRELSREAQGNPEASFPLEQAALSGDATHIVFATERTTYLLPGINLAGPPRAVANHRDLYVLDLTTNTIERATRAAGGADSQGDVAGAPTISADGGRIAFISDASDLFFGDANDRPDAFVLTRQPPPLTTVTPPKQKPVAPPSDNSKDTTPSGPRLSVAVKLLKRFRATLKVKAPAPGTVRASAAHITTAHATVHAAATVTLQLRARKAGKVTVTVRFLPASGGRALSRKVTVRFRR
ncbi:MAG: hypothetical protein JWN32_2417 [Solirubrobacterales bacterium]|nr:hypothetical protein [Solirubrobacterales bacterium]